MISIFRPKSDKKFEKSMKSMAYLLNATAAMRESLDKIAETSKQSRDFLGSLTPALIASMQSQLSILSKMEKFYETQIAWSEEQQKLQKNLEETDDDRRF